MNNLKRLNIFIFLIFFANVSQNLFGQSSRSSKYEIELGLLYTINMEIHGYQQSNALDGWRSYDPDIRFEYWSAKKTGWNFGGIIQPIYVKYSDTISNNLNYNRNVYRAGEYASLDYQFHSIRSTANYPILISKLKDTYLRLGGSLIVRYADIRFEAENESFHDTNLIAFPLFSFEANITLTKKYSFFTRGDFLPSPDGNLFLDGLFDVFFGIKTKLTNERSFDMGVRLFFGGYNPDTPEDYANRIFFSAFVVRYNW